MHNHIKVVGTGTYLPGKPIPFNEVEYYLGELTEAPEKITNWLKRIKVIMKEILDIDYYHYAIDPETREFIDDNITMSVKAAKKALKLANIQPNEIELIVYGSAHQDQMPTASVRIQDALGIDTCAEISVHANCTSAYKALLIAHDLLRVGRFKNALVVSSSISSSELRAEYYNQKVVKKEDLFLRWFLCDGAGAVVLKSEKNEENGLYLKNTYIESLGGIKPSAMQNKRPAYWMNPKEEYEKGYHHLSQLFQDKLRKHFHGENGSVFYNGLKRMLKKYKIDLTNLRFFQVNLPSKHIAELVAEECEKLGIKKEAIYSKMNKMGYSGPPTALITLDKIFREEKLNSGDLILSFVTEVSKFMQAGYLMQYK